MLPFLLFGMLFLQKTAFGGFNEAYHLPYKIAGLPIDEMLFFICIPYASIIIHYSLEYFKPKLLLSSKAVGKITFFLLILTALTLFFNLDKWYTSINYSLLIVTLLVALFLAKDILKRFYIAFVII